VAGVYFRDAGRASHRRDRQGDIEFPNDLLRELDRMEFFVYETRELVKATQRPVVFITSNNEKELPDAFLRRCFFHYIRFPDKETMENRGSALSGAEEIAASRSARMFFEVREVPGLKKKPSTSELLDWLSSCSPRTSRPTL